MSKLNSNSSYGPHRHQSTFARYNHLLPFYSIETAKKRIVLPVYYPTQQWLPSASLGLRIVYLVPCNSKWPNNPLNLRLVNSRVIVWPKWSSQRWFLAILSSHTLCETEPNLVGPGKIVLFSDKSQQEWFLF